MEDDIDSELESFLDNSSITTSNIYGSIEKYEKKLHIHSSILNDKFFVNEEEEEEESLDSLVKNMCLSTVEITPQNIKNPTNSSETTKNNSNFTNTNSPSINSNQLESEIDNQNLSNDIPEYESVTKTPIKKRITFSDSDDSQTDLTEDLFSPNSIKPLSIEDEQTEICFSFSLCDTIPKESLPKESKYSNLMIKSDESEEFEQQIPTMPSSLLSINNSIPKPHSLTISKEIYFSSEDENRDFSPKNDKPELNLSPVFVLEDISYVNDDADTNSHKQINSFSNSHKQNRINFQSLHSLSVNNTEIVDQNFVNALRSAKEQLNYIKESMNSLSMIRKTRNSSLGSFEYTRNPYNT